MSVQVDFPNPESTLLSLSWSPIMRPSAPDQMVAKTMARARRLRTGLQLRVIVSQLLVDELTMMGATKFPISARVCAAVGSSSPNKVHHCATPTPGRAAQTSAERAVQAKFLFCWSCCF